MALSTVDDAIDFGSPAGDDGARRTETRSPGGVKRTSGRDSRSYLEAHQRPAPPIVWLAVALIVGVGAALKILDIV